MHKVLSGRALHWLHILGALLSLLALIFVVWKFLGYRSQIDFQQYHSSQWIKFCFASLAYSLSCLSLSFAWRSLLAHYRLRVTRRWATWIYGVSQLVKYVPGNIFQFAGRQALGMGAGLPAGPLAKTVFWEIAVMGSVAAGFSFLIGPLLGGVTIVLSVLLFCLAILVLSICWTRIKGTEFLHAVFYYLGFLSITGILFEILLEIFCKTYQIPPSLRIPVAAAYIIAWLIGLLTPGAPAGLGVREVVLYFLLKRWVAQPELLTVIVLGRMMTLVGDIIFFILAMVIRFAVPGFHFQDKQSIRSEEI